MAARMSANSPASMIGYASNPHTDERAKAVTQNEPHDGLAALTAMLPEQHYQEPPPVAPEDAAAAKRRRRNRLIAGLLALLLVVGLVGGYAALALSAPVGVAASTAYHPKVDEPAAATIAMPQLGESAVSVAGADDYLGASADGILASGGGNAPMPMASISKLVTAMVVLSAKPLAASGAGPTLTFDKADHALYDKYYVLNATIAAMPTGSTMSEHDALETMLVVSACNYAEAISDWAFGSQAAFLSATKRWLKANGMTGTTMVESTGLDARNKSTPSDLITLGKLAMANPAIASIVTKKFLDLPSPALSGQPNTNDILGNDGINGIKTGTLDQIGSDLLFSAVVQVGLPEPVTVIGVILDGQSHGYVNTAVIAMIDSIKAGFHPVQLGSEGDVVGTYSTSWGAEASMVLGKDASTFTWSNTPITSTMTTTTLKTGANGEKVGSVTWVAGKNTVTVPVVLKGKIVGPDAWWKLTHPSRLFGG
jgi:D-alanyl-D-alanine carboxypeptidase (penicillin-binding protein 5/6)